MQLQPNFPETLTLPLSCHLDQSAEIMAVGLNEVIERSSLSATEVPDLLDFLSDFQQRREWMRQALCTQHAVD
jgi:hypothetical protein